MRVIAPKYIGDNARSDFYRLPHRMRIDGRQYRVGEALLEHPERLRVAVHLCRVGAARPADERTARDVELHGLLADALPR